MTGLLPAEIQTERVRLRAPLLADAEAIFAAYAQDSQVCRYMVWTPHESVATTRTFIAGCIQAWQEGSRLPYILVRQGADQPIGMLEARLSGSTVDIGYVLARPHWGLGLMPEAIQAFTLAALAVPALFRVQASCDVENLASQRALEKAGFVQEGRLERYTLHPNLSPEPRPCYLYARWR